MLPIFLDADLVNRLPIQDLAVGGHQRFGTVPIAPQRPRSQLFGGQMPQVLRNRLRSRIDRLGGHRYSWVLCRKRQPPVAALI